MNEYTAKQKEEANRPFEPRSMSDKKSLVEECLADVWGELTKRLNEIVRLRALLVTYDERLARHAFRVGDKVVVNDKGSAMGITGEKGTVVAVAGLNVTMEHDDGGYNSTLDGLFFDARTEG